MAKYVVLSNQGAVVASFAYPAKRPKQARSYLVRAINKLAWRVVRATSSKRG